MREVLEHDPEAYSDKEELLQPLLVMYNSLIETKDDSVANGRLLDVIRQARSWDAHCVAAILLPLT